MRRLVLLEVAVAARACRRAAADTAPRRGRSGSRRSCACGGGADGQAPAPAARARQPGQRAITAASFQTGQVAAAHASGAAPATCPGVFDSFAIGASRVHLAVGRVEGDRLRLDHPVLLARDLEVGRREGAEARVPHRRAGQVDVDVVAAALRRAPPQRRDDPGAAEIAGDVVVHHQRRREGRRRAVALGLGEGLAEVGKPPEPSAMVKPVVASASMSKVRTFFHGPSQL